MFYIQITHIQTHIKKATHQSRFFYSVQKLKLLSLLTWLY